MRTKYSRKHLFFVMDRSPQARNQEGAKPLEKFSTPQEECVGRILKLLDIVFKKCPPLRKLFSPLVSQAGYGPGRPANV